MTETLTHFIAGERISRSGSLESINPSDTREIVARFPDGGCSSSGSWGSWRTQRRTAARSRPAAAASKARATSTPPTIVTNVEAGVRLVDEEQFGTALPVLKYSKLDDAIEQANRTHYGLGSSVWSSDIERGKKVVQELDAGTGWVNHHLGITPFAPFGGAKWSGIGYENGRWGYEAFTELQVVNTKKA
jgi:acyl-CoA reductase-like NAD-dependent aldehyde dehydrogenase